MTKHQPDVSKRVHVHPGQPNHPPTRNTKPQVTHTNHRPRMREEHHPDVYMYTLYTPGHPNNDGSTTTTTTTTTRATP